MNRQITFRLAALALASSVLSGCVAALIPVAAGGVMFGKDKIGAEAGDVDASAAPSVAQATPTEVVAAPAPLPAATPPSLSPPPVPEVIVGSGFPVGGRPEEIIESPTQAEVETPPSDLPVMPPVFGPRIEPDEGDYADFFGFAAAMAARDPVDNPRQSAILADPGALDPATSECGILPPAVLVDLDPAGGTYDPERDAPPNPALAEALTNLRLQNVEVLWISSLSAGQAGAVRRRLVASGLDRFGRDPLLLMRRTGERKQTRRRELAQTHCLVAIAGDTRADFDELFDYLKDPSAAAPLEILIGNGWFLTPTPLGHPSAIPADTQDEKE